MRWQNAGDAEQRSPARRPNRELALLALLLILALFSRFWAIEAKSLYLDEAVSWRFANASITEMFDLIAHADNHPPLHYAILHFWVDLAGNSEAALRAPSAVAGAVTIVLLAAFAWRVGGSLLALTAALLLLFNTAHLVASQEARMYALTGLFSLAASGLLASFILKPSILRYAAYGGLIAALIYTHYSGLMVLAVHGLLFAGYGIDELVRKRSARVLLGALGTAAFLGLAYIPWFSTFHEHLGMRVAQIPEPSVAFVRDTSRSLLGLDKVGAAWLIFALPLLALGGYGLARRWRDPVAISIGALAFVPVIQIVSSIWFTPVFDVRQAAPYLPGLAFVLAVGLTEGRVFAGLLPKLAPVGHAAGLMLAIAMLTLMALRVQETYTGPSRQDWRSVAADLAGTAKPIFLAPGFQWQPLAYYRGTTFGVTPLWQADVRRIVGGDMPVPQEQLQREGILIAQGHGGRAVVPAFERYFRVEGLNEYRGNITTYDLYPIAASRDGGSSDTR